mgnify:CR=1 FL=1
MSDLLSGPIPAIIILMACYAWLSRAMAAMKALNESRVRQQAEDGDADAGALLPIFEVRERTLQTLQLCKTLLALLIGGVAALFIEHPLSDWMSRKGVPLPEGLLRVLCLLVTTLIFAAVMYLICSQIPRRLAERNPARAAQRSMKMVRFLTRILQPAEELVGRAATGVLRIFGIHMAREEPDVTEDDILLMVDRGEESGAIEENEKELIENIFEFNNRNAGDVMTHRTGVTALWIGDDRDTVISTIRTSGLSRFPVYDKDMDDVIGILSTRDYLLNAQSEKPRPMKALLRPAYFVPTTVQADTLFRDMQKRKTHMAIVVDEYGGVSGIVTLEDLLEEIVGNIYDEFDPQQDADITQVDDNLWRISGAAPLEDVEEALNVRFADDEYDTLGGLIFGHLTTIPADGSHPEMQLDGLNILVERLWAHRVETALVSRLPDPQPEAEADDRGS